MFQCTVTALPVSCVLLYQNRCYLEHIKFRIIREYRQEVQHDHTYHDTDTLQSRSIPSHVTF